MIVPEGSIPATAFSEITCSTFETRRSFQPEPFRPHVDAFRRSPMRSGRKGAVEVKILRYS
jgi:hypothetical protein